MYESLLDEANRLFPNKGVLSIEEIAQVLDCETVVIYNWTRRSNPDRRPPRLLIGRGFRFTKKEFFKWLSEIQATGNAD